MLDLTPSEKIEYLECFRCGSVKELVPFEYTKLYTSYWGGAHIQKQKYSITLHACQKCYNELGIWQSVLWNKQKKFCLS